MLIVRHELRGKREREEQSQHIRQVNLIMKQLIESQAR